MSVGKGPPVRPPFSTWPTDVQYWDKHKKIRPVRSSAWQATAFADGVAGHGGPLVTRRFRKVLPGVTSDQETYLLFMRELSRRLNERFVPDLDEELFSRSGIHTNFDRLRTVPGYMMNPMSYTMMSNATYRDSLGLTRGYSPVQKAIATNVWRIVWSHYKMSPIKLTKKSTSGMRRFTKDPTWKFDYALWVYETNRFEKVLTCVHKKDWLELANTFEMFFATYIQKREQVDTPGKPREVFDAEYAATNGARGQKRDADKRVVILGKEWADFSATRARVIHAGPWVINCLLSIVSTGTMQALFERFPKLFHTNTEEELKAVIDGSFVFSGDVKEYDRSMDEDAIRVAHDTAKEFWDERLIDMSLILYFSPYYARPLNLDGREGLWFGDPRVMDPQVICGNRSGHGWTSLMAKVNKFIETLFIFHGMGLPVLGNEMTYLESRGAINDVNNGDDETIYSPSRDLMTKFAKVRADKNVGHYVVTREEGQVFSGLLILKTDVPQVYKPTPRLHTSFEKFYCNERDIGGEMRPFWFVGLADRINRRGEHPCGEAAWEIHDKLYHDMMAPRYGTIFSMLSTAAAQSPVNMDGITKKDREVLEDPDKIHYKFADGEISDKVMNEVVSRIPTHFFEHIVREHYKGVVH